MKTRFVPPMLSQQAISAQLLRTYPFRDRQVVQLWLSHAGQLVYSSSTHATGLLEVEGIPHQLTDRLRLAQVLSGTYAKVVSHPSGELKLSIFQRGEGGGLGEVVLGVLGVAAGIGLAVVSLPAAVPAAVATGVATVGAGAVAGAGGNVLITGWQRDEDLWDGELASSALKGAASGAISGLIGGGMGGAIVKKVGAQTVLAKQSIHAVVNAAEGALQNVATAQAEMHWGTKEEQERAKERMSGRNIVASAVGGAFGGLAGAHVGAQAKKLSGSVARSAAATAGGLVVGAGAGAAGGAAAASVVNVCQGKKATEKIWVAVESGGASGLLTGAAASIRVSRKLPAADAKPQPIEESPQPAPPAAEQPVEERSSSRFKPAKKAAPDTPFRAEPKPQAPQRQAGAAPTSTSPDAIVKQNQGLVQEKIDQLQQLQGEVASAPSLFPRVQQDIDYQSLLQQAMAHPEDAVSKILEDAYSLPSGQSFLLPTGALGQPESVLFKHGADLYLFEGETAQNFLRQSGQALSEFLQEHMPLDPSRGMEELASRASHYMSQVHQDALQAPIRAASSRAAGASWELFSSFEQTRIFGILERFQEFLLGLNERLDGYNATIDHLANAYARCR